MCLSLYCPGMHIYNICFMFMCRCVSDSFYQNRFFVNRHRRKVLFTLGIVGGGYALYRVYCAQKERMLVLEEEEEAERRADELVEIRLREHFESLQRMSDSSLLAAALDNLKDHLFEALDYTELTERLNKGKGHLIPQEKLQLWERLKILSIFK